MSPGSNEYHPELELSCIQAAVSPESNEYHPELELSCIQAARCGRSTGSAGS